MSTNTSLYLLVHRSNIAFKVGVTVNTLNRILNLGGIEQFDLEKSYEIIWPSARDAFKTEKSLHFLYENFNIPAPDGIRDGLTEWFDIGCLEDVIADVKYFMGDNSPH